MKATILAADLRKVARFMVATVERRNTIPVLGMVRIVIKGDNATFTGTDLDNEVSVSVWADDAADGAVMIGIKRLIAIAAIGEAATFHLVKGVLTVTVGEMTFALKGFVPVEDFPIMNPVGGESVTVDPAEVIRFIRLCRPCISTEETRYYLNGIYLHPIEGHARAVSTDGRRLAHVDTTLPAPPEGYILPRKALGLINMMAGAVGNNPCSWTFTEKQVRMGFIAGDVTLKAKTIDGTFPDYTRVPKQTDGLSFGLTQSTVRRIARAAAVVTDEKTRAIAFYPDDGKIKITGPDVGDVTINVPGLGIGLRIKFDLRLIRSISDVAGDFVARGNTEGDPIKITTDDPSAFWVVMPMRI